MPPTAQILGASQAAQAIEAEIECAAGSDAKVLITGESGVGKEVVARLIHERSARRHAPLVAINCAGIPDTLLASELFGHARGSFTDAYRDKQGWIEQAHRGTIFLDEIGEMSPQMQALLLRFLENGEIQRVGSDRKTTSVDVRVIAATNRRLIECVSAGEFREDLYYRLNVIHIEIPPLRERREDIAVMFDHFLRQFAESHKLALPSLDAAAAARVAAADWPGNVRELRNVAERLVVRARAGVIRPSDLPREILSMSAATPGITGAAPETAVMFKRMVQDGETFWRVVYEPFMSRDITRQDVRALIRQALELSRGNYKSLAQLFNVAPEYKRLLNFLRKYECYMPIEEFRPTPLSVQDPLIRPQLRHVSGRAASSPKL